MSQPLKIVITSANCFTAGLLIPALKAKGYYTIGLIRNPQTIESDETITNWMNNDKAKRALQDADHIIHLSGEINSKKEAVYIQANKTSTQIVAEAASVGKARRLIFLSYPGADACSKNLYLRYKGEAEKILSAAGKEAVIFRCPIIIDSPDKPSRIDTLFISQNGKAIPVIGDGRQMMQPVYRGDVVKMIVSALEHGDPGIYELSGPERLSLTGFVQLVNQNPAVKIRYTAPWLAKLLANFIKGLSTTFVDILLNHADSEFTPATYKKFGIQPTSLTTLWSRRQ
ncbi:NAD-dependent epimerase/dehydratase family protein [Chitinophaga sp. G-6-1-13]|uniref:NAD-dependent epimerase/dehydratase family protein n=1 Tax=Chitinophaga fulva TaxID=2728842 RepID=A0A848GQ82_9BACT|nr:NAD-dependent epimerase/dehydratase family protein [Chitinophaga fulva]NML39711.1 NAD-dependent epimerase/dehydratase family protein [Chitinophaga fulva]